jgi:hypothetical protein
MQLVARTHTSTAAALQRRSVTKAFNRALELSRLLVEWANALDRTLDLRFYQERRGSNPASVNGIYYIFDINLINAIK